MPRRRAPLLGVVVAAIAAGTAIGVAGVSLTRDDGASTTGGPGAAPSGSSQRSGARVAPTFTDVSVRMVSAILHPAETARGRRRQRARLSVHAVVMNGRDSAVVLGRPQLLSGRTKLGVDMHADAPAGALLRRLPAGATADGVLRFETAGPVTRQLTSERRVALRIAGRTVRATVKLGTPAKPAG